MINMQKKNIEDKDKVIEQLEIVRRKQHQEILSIKNPLKPFHDKENQNNKQDGLLRLDRNRIALVGIENAELERDRVKDYE